MDYAFSRNFYYSTEITFLPNVEKLKSKSVL